MTINEIFYSIFKKYQPNTLINNLNNELTFQEFNFFVTHIQEKIYVFTQKINKITPNCYVVSPYSMCISYGLNELHKLKWLLKWTSYLMIKSFGLLLKIANIDKNIFINNLMLSTNFYDENMEKYSKNFIEGIDKLIINQNKDYTMILRSINEYSNNNLYQNLLKNDWLPIVSRQVYIFDDWNTIIKSHNVKMDIKLLNSKKFSFIEPNINNFIDFQEAEKWYNVLYLEKYSKQNVQFSALYLKELYQNGLLHLRLLKNNENDKIVGVVGIIGNETILTAPIVGYDTSYLQKDALYRRIIAYILNYSMIHQKTLNLSSGASNFKTLRGGKPIIEYMMIKPSKKIFFNYYIWLFLSYISNTYYKTILQRYKL